MAHIKQLAFTIIVGLIILGALIAPAQSGTFPPGYSPLPTPPEAGIKPTPTPALPRHQLPSIRQPVGQRNTSAQNIDPGERAFYEGMAAMCAWQGDPCDEAVRQAKAQDWFRHWQTKGE